MELTRSFYVLSLYSLFGFTLGLTIQDTIGKSPSPPPPPSSSPSLSTPAKEDLEDKLQLKNSGNITENGTLSFFSRPNLAKLSHLTENVMSNMFKEFSHLKKGDNMSCVLYTQNDMHSIIGDLLRDGTKLMEFDLNFGNYEKNPLESDILWNYKSHTWYRAYDVHGKTLLTLAFNYDVLSLSMLTFGVKKLNVSLFDEPSGCFGKMGEVEKIKALLYIITVDFGNTGVENEYKGSRASSCHQFIQKEGKYGTFQFMCCHWEDDTIGGDASIQCTLNEQTKWFKLLFLLLAGVKIIALLFGPLFLQWIMHSQSIRKACYIVPLKETLTINGPNLLKGKTDLPREGRRRLKRFKKMLNEAPQDTHHQVAFNKLHLFVDHSKLMLQETVPVGLFNFLYENLVLCKIMNWPTLSTCCSSSIFGSWTSRFLCINLPGCTPGRRIILTWGQLTLGLGGLILILMLPLPYYIRVFIYYSYEHSEVQSRLDALAALGLEPVYSSNLLHYLTPLHGLLVAIYCLYLVSVVVLLVIKYSLASHFEEVIVDALQDLRHISRLDCFRLLISHAVLPLEKFGLLGLVVGFVYWPLMLPLCILVTLCYCIPSVYLTGRFLIDTRPKFLRRYPKLSLKRNVHPLSSGTNSLEEVLFLNRISHQEGGKRTNRIFPHKSCSVSWITGIAAVCLMFSFLFMFSEIFGFVIEVFVFTLMGTIVNASQAAQYMMLIFWITMYASSCFNFHYENYLKLSSKLFEFIKAKLSSDIQKVAVLSRRVQENTGFKYYTNNEIQTHLQMEKDLESSESEYSNNNEEAIHVSDTIENINGHLYWKVNSLVLFLDNKDTPRMPKALFREICNIEAPGCPGPVYASLMTAVLQLFYMLLFLLFVMIVVMTFIDVYSVSTTNQLLMTLAGGFLPFFIRLVMTPKVEAIHLDTYSFEGKVQQIIRNYRQRWPVSDLSYSENRFSQEQGNLGQPSSRPTGSKRRQEDALLTVELSMATIHPNYNSLGNKRESFHTSPTKPHNNINMPMVDLNETDNTFEL